MAGTSYVLCGLYVPVVPRYLQVSARHSSSLFLFLVCLLVRSRRTDGQPPPPPPPPHPPPSPHTRALHLADWLAFIFASWRCRRSHHVGARTPVRPPPWLVSHLFHSRSRPFNPSSSAFDVWPLVGWLVWMVCACSSSPGLRSIFFAPAWAGLCSMTDEHASACLPACPPACMPACMPRFSAETRRKRERAMCVCGAVVSKHHACRVGGDDGRLPSSRSWSAPLLFPRPCPQTDIIICTSPDSRCRR